MPSPLVLSIFVPSCSFIPTNCPVPVFVQEYNQVIMVQNHLFLLPRLCRLTDKRPRGRERSWFYFVLLLVTRPHSVSREIFVNIQRQFVIELPVIRSRKALPALPLTCDDFRSLWSRSNLNASRRKFFTVWPPNPS